MNFDLMMMTKMMFRKQIRFKEKLTFGIDRHFISSLNDLRANVHSHHTYLIRAHCNDYLRFICPTMMLIFFFLFFGSFVWHFCCCCSISDQLLITDFDFLGRALFSFWCSYYVLCVICCCSILFVYFGDWQILYFIS